MRHSSLYSADDTLHKPFDLTLQWHITERCNLRCAHCYQEDYSTAELTFQDMLLVVEQFKDLIYRLKKEKKSIRIRGHINVSGGEPFIRSDFMDLLGIFSQNSKYFSYGILTNGTLIDENVAKQLRSLGVSFVQVSIEGSKFINDEIRGRGVFDKTVSALRRLRHEKINSWISFTAHKNNFREFPEVARLGAELGVQKVWSDRLIPSGSGAAIKDQLLSPEETRDFFEIMFNAQSQTVSSFSQTTISMHRALQFLVGGGPPYHCGAGDILVTIQSNGDLVPCRRMPIRVGNVMDTPLAELYFKDDLFIALRNPDRISHGCEECFYAEKCGGGLKCLSYAITGSPFNADPGCWLKTEKKTVY